MGKWFFWEVAIAAVIIAISEWKRLQEQPGKDRIVFLALLLAGAVLSFLNLPDTPGPTSVMAYVFKPLRPLVEP
ncbi:hypothetical protein COLU111180_17020 [Cohnella lubricantis]|uniref:Uncharacterized protein n=1 Tax=Cohnella lubricantis TaxID=2163172 RepID=A0A841TFE8_9BACL|nr:hypothetical protein [Cohnella lubricantis]MBB6677950.1 hypothetical protein [Cohnella lubricantis]MBP2119982.1 hypothetical protein [Cohnella lubricantis]